jgi:C-terminal processing protease CtpA/Prc
MIRFVASVLSILFTYLGPAAWAADPPSLPDPGFEQGQAGQLPSGWTVPEDAAASGYTAQVVTEKPESGRQCILLAAGDRPDQAQAFGNLVQSVDAAPYRGKKVRFRAAIRTELDAAVGERARIWIGLDRPKSPSGGRYDYTSKIANTSEWARYEAVGDVPQDTRALNLGLALVGNGKAWLDSLSLEVVGEAGAGNEPARALTERGLENLVAFARLFGYVRYFHPSDQAAAADWEKLAFAGVQAAEKAAGPEELARALESFFLPVAPTVRVFANGRKPALPAELSSPGEAAERITWAHLGVGLNPASVYKSERITSKGSQAPGAAMGQMVSSVESLKGKRVRLRAAARVDDPGHPARLRMTTYRSNGSESRLASLEPPITSTDWSVYELTAEVPAEIEAFAVELALDGEGIAWWDDVSLEVVGEEPPATPLLDNGGFEEGDDEGLPTIWATRSISVGAGYRLERAGTGVKSGRSSGVLAYRRPERPLFPDPADPFLADLGGGVSALVPLALFKDKTGTLPHVPAAEVRPPAPDKPDIWTPSGNDRTTRLADVILAWNVFQHFYPYFDVVSADWPAELRRALAGAATDADERAFLDTLRRLVAALRDGHGSAFHPAAGGGGQLPLVWDWVEGQLAVTRVASGGAGGLAPGDVILSLDGRPAAEVLAAREELVSGATPQWRRYVALQELLGGPEGEEVKLEVRRAGGETFSTVLERSVSREILEEARPEKIAEVRPGIFYLDLDRINDKDFQGALDRLAAAKGVIFDLRGYPGNLSTIVIAHLTGKPVTSARWNVPQVPRPDREGMQFHFSNWTVRPKEPRLRAKVAFLTDGRAISYAETYLGIIEHYKLAEIVGAPTAGTNGNVNPFTLPGGYRVSWTGMKVLKHDGSRHHGVGIQPTVPVSRTLKGVAEGRDEVLEKAIEVVGG